VVSEQLQGLGVSCCH